DNLARLIFRVFFIIENMSQWVSKNRQRFFKINPVSGAISLSLLPVPLKLETHSGLNHITELAARLRFFAPPSSSSMGWSARHFSSRRRHTRSKRDWSSDVCSSD